MKFDSITTLFVNCRNADSFILVLFTYINVGFIFY